MIVNVRHRFAIAAGVAIVVAAGASIVPASAGKQPPAGQPSALQTCHTPKACFVETNTTGGNAIHGDSRYGHGIVGTTHADPGGFGPGSSAVYGRDLAGYGFSNTGVTGISTVGTGMYGHSIEGAGLIGSGNPGVLGDGYTFGNGFWTGVTAIGGTPKATCDMGYPCVPALAATSNYAKGSGVKLFAAFDSTKDLLAYIDDSGNMFLSGQIYTSGLCKTGCIETHNSSGKSVVAYTPRQSSPSIEDFGQGQLAAGAGYVRIEAGFAATMDRAAHYLVFITPHGDSRGLYVTDETASGFWVRENGGGRATMSFDYRIVAKPFDANEPRLPEYRPHDLGKIRVSQPARSVLDALTKQS